MSRPLLPRVFVITLILAVFAAITINGYWASGIYAAVSTEAALAPPASVLTTVPVSLPNVTSAQGSIATIPIAVGDLTGLVVTSYELQITYDPTVLQPANPPYERAGTLSSGIAINPNAQNPGHLVIVAYQPSVLSGSGTLLNLIFNVIGASTQSSALVFEDWTNPNPSGNPFHPGCRFNEGTPFSSTTNGSLTVGGATPTGSPTPTATNQATPTASPLLPVQAMLPNVNAAPGSTISIPVSISDVTGFGVRAYEMQVSYDPAVVQPASPAFDLTGTVGDTMFPFPLATNPGHLIIQALSHSPAISGSGVLLYLRFTVVGTTGRSTELRLENWTNPANHLYQGFMFNEGYPSRTTTNGSVTVSETAISGAVTYANATGGLIPPLVSNVLISGAGAVAGLAMTDDDGTYFYSGFGSGSYTITPSKTGGVNGSISSYDAAKVAEHVAGINHLGTFQKYVANVSGDLGLTSFDAAMIAKFVAGPPYTGPGIGSTGTWRFQPSSRSYPLTAGIITNENYGAILMGEVSGNWANTGGRSVAKSTTSIRNARIGVTAPMVTAKPDMHVLIPVAVHGAGRKGIISYEFDLRYDPSVIQPQTIAAELAGTVSRGLSVVANAIEPGLLRVVVYGAMPIENDGVLLNLRFTAVGKAGAVSPLTWERVMFNEGEPRVSAADGQVELF